VQPAVLAHDLEQVVRLRLEHLAHVPTTAPPRPRPHAEQLVIEDLVLLERRHVRPGSSR
jgi:hypothetical protein